MLRFFNAAISESFCLRERWDESISAYTRLSSDSYSWLLIFLLAPLISIRERREELEEAAGRGGAGSPSSPSSTCGAGEPVDRSTASSWGTGSLRLAPFFLVRRPFFGGFPVKPFDGLDGLAGGSGRSGDGFWLSSMSNSC